MKSYNKLPDKYWVGGNKEVCHSLFLGILLLALLVLNSGSTNILFSESEGLLTIQLWKESISLLILNLNCVRPSIISTIFTTNLAQHWLNCTNIRYYRGQSWLFINTIATSKGYFTNMIPSNFEYFLLLLLLLKS